MAESGLDLRAVQETLDWHDAPPEVGEVVQTSTEHELAITQLRALLAHCRALRAALVQANIPYAGLLMDHESRRWIAPSIWRAMETSSERAAEVLRGVQDPEGP